MTSQKSFVMYLDIDDTLLIHNNSVWNHPAPECANFVKWALEHFHVKWLTSWCPSGILSDDDSPFDSVGTLSSYTGIDSDILRTIRNDKSWFDSKLEGIDFTDPRPICWIENEMLSSDLAYLLAHNKADIWLKTDVSRDPLALQKTWHTLGMMYNLPLPSHIHNRHWVVETYENYIQGRLLNDHNES